MEMTGTVHPCPEQAHKPSTATMSCQAQS